MFRRLFANVSDYSDLCNGFATAVTRFARLALRSTVLTQREKVDECARLVELYRAVNFRRVQDYTDTACEIAILLRCLNPDDAEWRVAARLQPVYVV